ncbi:MAG: 5,6-dimethylbenzimidazole synthase [Methylobacteriaceae bacterium]|nr:5,6-dimethylbenzimidazole synthase [Methylobacteriaceae bacterium]
MSDSPAPVFDDAFRSRLRELIAWRRDVRHFHRDPLPAGSLERLIECACLAPSVGLSQPWRFVIVEDAERRAAIGACFESCNADALRAQTPERAALYARLKLAGLDDAPGQIAVFADRDTSQGHALGRLTMPQTIDYSVVMAVHTLWLAARAEGIGVGWVSILDPARVAAILQTPPAWALIGYLCVGYPVEETESPVLERDGWETRRRSSDCILNR